MHLAYKAENVVDLEGDLILTAESDAEIEEIAADEGYHSAGTSELCEALGLPLAVLTIAMMPVLSSSGSQSQVSINRCRLGSVAGFCAWSLEAIFDSLGTIEGTTSDGESCKVVSL